MRYRLIDAPWWVLALVTGVPFGAFTGIRSILDGDDVMASGVASVVAGIFFGVLMGLFLARTNKRTSAAIGAMPADRAAAVYRSAAKGPVPDDPEVRAGAARLVAHQLDQTQRSLGWSVVLFLALLLASAWLAVSSSPWWWCAVALWCAATGWSLWLPSRLRRRLLLLTA